MFQVVGDCSVGEGLEERLDCSDPLEVRLVEEPSAHRARHVEQDGDSFFGLPGDDWLHVLELNGFLYILAADIRRHQVKVHRFFLACEHVEDVVGFTDIFAFAHENSELALLVV